MALKIPVAQNSSNHSMNIFPVKLNFDQNQTMNILPVKWISADGSLGRLFNKDELEFGDNEILSRQERGR